MAEHTDGISRTAEIVKRVHTKLSIKRGDYIGTIALEITETKDLEVRSDVMRLNLSISEGNHLIRLLQAEVEALEQSRDAEEAKERNERIHVHPAPPGNAGA